MAEKSASNLVTAIDASKSRSLKYLLHALGIRHVGSRLAEILAEHFESMESLMATEIEELKGVEEVGAVVAQSVVDFFTLPENQALIARLRSSGLTMVEQRRDPAESNAAIAGKTFVVTGTLTQFTRDEIHERIKALGGKASGSISAKTDYLIAGEKAGSKLAKAESLGVRVLTEDDFQRMLTEPS
jgi:DNA ligase (NAD+)